ncbi:A24 family peptidase [Paenisporosarcina sp. NPDC076898]|uniref:A24 family peptidase n=1 Tax=unclassified Paenisporosarcina TaxID=2642018 RepID=UPI003D04AE9E
MTNVAIILILIISVITDVRHRKIFNLVTLPAILLAFIYHSFVSGLEGFLYSGEGFLVGLGLLIIPFLLGGIGAGDVKLLAAVGAWKGTTFIFYTGIYAGLLGGLIAIVLLLKRRELGYTIKQMLFSAVVLKSTNGALLIKNEMPRALSLPYAVPIALGVLSTFLMETFG